MLSLFPHIFILNFNLEVINIPRIQIVVILIFFCRHSRFGGTFVVKSMKSISDNELIYHKPLAKLDSLNFDVDKKKPKTPKNRLPVSWRKTFILLLDCWKRFPFYVSRNSGRYL